MSKSAQKRISNYRYALQPQRVADTLTAKKEEMIAHASEVMIRQCEVEELTHGVLASETTVTSIFLPWYLDFSRELDSRSQRLNGAQIQNEALVLIAKWTMRGLTERILVRIRDEVFSIQEPPAK